MPVRRLVLGVVVALLLGPALVLTVDRLVEPHASFWLLLEGFAPLAIILYGGAALVLGVRLLFVRTRATWAAAAVALAGLVLHCWWFAPQVTGANPPPAAGAEPLVVMNANIAQDDGDPIELVRMAGEEDVDLLVVEEITAADLADLDRSGIADLLPYRVGEPGTESDGTMVFSRTEPGPAERLDTWHDGWIFSLGDLTVIATHPQAPTLPDVWADDHAALLDAVRGQRPDLVVGDLNATADHGPMRALADAGYRDVGELANEGWQPTWPANDRFTLVPWLGHPMAQIDHVLVGPRMAAIRMHTDPIPGSDHRAVVAEVARR
ncbi:endonuclease/exonuclease/phosphatase family protein [Nocardioides sp. URHA0032]|uniref:endonuclease/exonuclease/phosphatase family protein n=1 Tax=Nocardioides sp. URHA0032 TaxID=1380388 RepID=UPI00048F9BE1|nr:endonuclease/exonuclease/phosphatase family protein [Nocardioides sp. URHA0032]